MAREETAGRVGAGRRAGGTGQGPRRLRYVIGAAGALLLVLASGIYYASARSNPNSSAGAPASSPAASAASALPSLRPGAPIEGISCAAEMLDYHIHAALVMYDHGRRVMLPADVGIPVNASIPGGYCLYSLHTHDFDHAAGIVHIESPTPRTYTLGQFLDVWHYTAVWDKQGGLAAANKISVDASFPDALRRARPGDIHAYVGGKPVRSYRAITLTAHAVITVELGAPLAKPATHADFPEGE